MSTPPTTYACEICTFIQPIDGEQCVLCGSPNPNRSKSQHRNDDMSFGDGMATCPQCQLISVGHHIRVCEHCGHEFDEQINPAKKLRVNQYEDNEADNDNDNDDDDDNYEDYQDVLSEDFQTPQKNSEKRKPIEAVEKAMNDDELKTYYNQYIAVLEEQRQPTKTITEKQLHEIICQLFRLLQYKNDNSDGQLIYRCCQICYDKSEPMITMKACGHRMICSDDFHQYLTTRIRDGELLPWIPCPAETCNVPCDAQNLIEDGRLTFAELLSFITAYMLKKLSRNENFITCAHCSQGGFLQLGPAKKEQVQCQICNVTQTIEKGCNGELDITFKRMIASGELRECPTCRHFTLKEKGLCNVIECAKCGVWWNWRTREQGHSEKDLKQRARMNGTLWEPGELHYQQILERTRPEEFKALLERNGISYNPNYVRGGWNDS